MLGSSQQENGEFRAKSPISGAGCYKMLAETVSLPFSLLVSGITLY